MGKTKRTNKTKKRGRNGSNDGVYHMLISSSKVSTSFQNLPTFVHFPEPFCSCCMLYRVYSCCLQECWLVRNLLSNTRSRNQCRLIVRRRKGKRNNSIYWQHCLPKLYPNYYSRMEQKFLFKTNYIIK